MTKVSIMGELFLYSDNCLVLAAKPEPVNCKQLFQCRCLAGELLFAWQINVVDHAAL